MVDDYIIIGITAAFLTSTIQCIKCKFSIDKTVFKGAGCVNLDIKSHDHKRQRFLKEIYGEIFTL